MGLALNLRQIVGQLLQLDVVGNGPQLKHNAGTMEMRNSTDTGFVITRGSDPVGNNDFVTKGAGDLAYWRSVNPNWLVTDWYIDGVTGDDTNSGTVIGSPIKTGAELIKRLGPYAMWPQSVTVHVLANGMIDALILRGAMMVAGTHLDVVGTPTQLADAGTVATYTALNHATPEATLITTTGIADWTPYNRRRIRVTSGPRIGSVLWIATANPAGLGLNTIRCTQPISINETSTSAMTATANLVVGDPIIVESLPSIPSVSLFVDGPVSSLVAPLWPQRQFSILHLSTPILKILATTNTRINGKMLFGCRLSSVNWGQQSTLAINNFITAYGSSFFAENSQELPLVCNAATALFGEGFIQLSLSTPVFLQNAVLQGASLGGSFGVPVLGSTVQVFDVLGATSVACGISYGIIFALSGRGNAGYGLGIGNNSQVRFTGTQNLQGAVSNGRLTSAPATNLTLPQLLQPSDYAQKGTSVAMVAGTITITVPWYDNTVQKVTVSHAAFAGTPGILSVQQISNTQFTITSSSALDTSTVNWTISPLGRNIFISTT